MSLLAAFKILFILCSLLLPGGYVLRTSINSWYKERTPTAALFSLFSLRYPPPGFEAIHNPEGEPCTSIQQGHTNGRHASGQEWYTENSCSTKRLRVLARATTNISQLCTLLRVPTQFMPLQKNAPSVSHATYLRLEAFSSNSSSKLVGQILLNFHPW